MTVPKVRRRPLPLALLIIAAAGVILVGFALLSDTGSNPPGGEIRLEPLGPVPADAHWVSPSGSDSASGMRARPWRTLERALESLGPGDTLVVSPGTYGERGSETRVEVGGVEGAPITIRGEPGQPRPRVLGAVRITAGHLRIARLLFDGPTGMVQEPTDDNPRGEQVQLAIRPDDGSIRDILIDDCEVRGSDWHAGIFIVRAEDVRIVGSHVHDNGDEQDPAQANLSHGIYWDSGSGVVANSVVENNVARGIQLYPEPSGVLITHNTVAHNGRAGIQLGNEASGNLIVNNIVVLNGDRGIRSASLSGKGNIARMNLVWGNAGEIDEPDGALVVTDVLAEAPRFADPSYRLDRNSPAVDRGIETGAVPFDRDGRRRPNGKAADLGAYESW